MPEDKPDDEGLFVLCAKGRDYSEFHLFKNITHRQIIYEYAKYKGLTTCFTVSEIDSIYELDTYTRISLKEDRDKQIKDSSIKTYFTHAKYTLLHIFKYAKPYFCDENKCECRVMIPLAGYYDSRQKSYDRPGRPMKYSDIQTLMVNSLVKKPPSLLDVVDESKMKYGLLLFDEEVIDVMRYSHRSRGHIPVARAPLITDQLHIVGKDKINVIIAQKKEKYLEYRRRCDFCNRTNGIFAYIKPYRGFKIIIYLSSYFLFINHTSLSRVSK